jgi:hypothetical protein
MVFIKVPYMKSGRSYYKLAILLHGCMSTKVLEIVGHYSCRKVPCSPKSLKAEV